MTYLLIKVVFAGDAAVGKTSFINRITKGVFLSNLSSTLGEYLQTLIIINHKNGNQWWRLTVYVRRFYLEFPACTHKFKWLFLEEKCFKCFKQNESYCHSKYVSKLRIRRVKFPKQICSSKYIFSGFAAPKQKMYIKCRVWQQNSS